MNVTTLRTSLCEITITDNLLDWQGRRAVSIHVYCSRRKGEHEKLVNGRKGNFTIHVIELEETIKKLSLDELNEQEKDLDN